MKIRFTMTQFLLASFLMMFAGIAWMALYEESARCEICDGVLLTGQFEVSARPPEFISIWLCRDCRRMYFTDPAERSR